MPIKIQNDLPARAILESENVFIMDEARASSQDIRPLDPDPESDALKGGHRDPAFKGLIQHPLTGGMYVYDHVHPRIHPHLRQPLK